METLKQIKKYPIMVLFFLFLAVFSIADALMPDLERSEYENRKLAQFPAFNAEDFLNNKWTVAFGEYTRDQFLGRDQWVNLHGVLEVAQGKLEAGGVWFAKDGYQIAKNSTWSNAQDIRFPENVASVSSLAEKYPGQVQVMVVPSPANILSDELPWSPPQIDENAMTDDMFAQMRAAGADVIDLREDFAAAHAAGEPIYYRTDHHWTTTGGAWMAYEAFCEANGLQAVPPDPALLVEVPDFYGTNYAKTKRIGTKPDTLAYYDLPNAMEVHALNSAGAVEVTDTGLMDKPKLDEYDKYAAFLYGNNGYSVIQGNGEGSILVVKDSYGNSFVPYLVENYATIGVIDLRMWFSVAETFEEGGYDDILVLYSFASFSEDAYISRMAQ